MDEPNGPTGRDGPAGRVTTPGRAVRRWLITAVAAFAILALINAYGRTVATFIQDVWGPDFSFFDNAQTVQVKLHRLPPATDHAQAPAGAAWPEKVLRPACHFTLSLMGLSGPEGELWLGSLEGQPPALVVRATWSGGEVGRYRVTEGREEAGLVVVELDAGPNGVHLMDLQQPRPGDGWYVVQVYRAPD